MSENAEAVIRSLNTQRRIEDENARLRQQLERMPCGHLRAEWAEELRPTAKSVLGYCSRCREMQAVAEAERGWVSVSDAMPAPDSIPNFAKHGLSETVEMWDESKNLWIGSYNSIEKIWWINQGAEDDAPLPEIYEVTHWRVIVGPNKTSTSLADMLDKARDKALVDAAKIMCATCLNGNEPTENSDGLFMHLKGTAKWPTNRIHRLRKGE